MQREQGKIPLQLRPALTRKFLRASAADVGWVVDWWVEMYAYISVYARSWEWEDIGEKGYLGAWLILGCVL